MPTIHATKEQLKRIGSFDTANYVTFDTETTGLDRKTDEVLELAIVDSVGNVLFNQRFKPTRHTTWTDAQKKHGITPSDVMHEPTINYYAQTISQILESANLIVGYNLEFDLSMLAANGVIVNNPRRFDLMLEYAPVYSAEWLDWKNDYKWVK